MSKTLCIPDIHQDIKFAERCLKLAQDCDKVVFLGDFFDTFRKDVGGFKETCKFLRELVVDNANHGKYEFCVGNHDLYYIYQNKKPHNSSVVMSSTYYCSGVTKNKISKFRKEFYDEGLGDEWFFNNFKLAYHQDGWSFSHAGILSAHIPQENFMRGETIEDFINRDCPIALREFRNYTWKHNYLLADVGRKRGGDALHGGLLWCDWEEEFRPSEYVGKQVLGHSCRFRGVAEVMSKSTNMESWCIDCAQRCCTIVENGKFTVIYI